MYVKWNHLVLVLAAVAVMLYLWAEHGGKKGSLPNLPNTNPATRTEQ